MESVAASNQEATDAWSGPLFDAFTKFRDLVDGGLGAHGEAAMDGPPAADRASACSTSAADSATRRSGSPSWSARRARRSALDVAAPFIEQARKEAEGGPPNVSFAVADVQVGDLGEGFDYAFSRMGLMFFANPVQALRNIRSALAPGGRLCAVVWRRKEDNDWLRRAELVVDEYLEHPEETDQPTCGPGPFSMANADTVSEQLKIAGFEQITLQRCDLPLKIGNDLDHAVEFNMALGPAGEVLRLWEDRIDEIRPKIAAELREALAEFEGPDGRLRPGLDLDHRRHRARLRDQPRAAQ